MTDQKAWHKKRKKSDREAMRDLEEEDQRLTASLFQSGGAFLAGGDDEQEDAADSEDLYAFEIDREGEEDEDTEENDIDGQGLGREKDERMQREPDVAKTVAWVDEDDLDVNLMQNNSSRVRKLRKTIEETTISGSAYEERLRERFQVTTQSTSNTDWAQLVNDDDDDDDEEEEDSIQQAIQSSNKIISAGPLLDSKRRLVPNILDTKRCSDLNLDEPSKAVVQSVHFHRGSDPSKPIALTAGLDKTLRFFQVTEEKSEKIHAIHFPTLPIISACFLGSTGTVVASGRRPFFFLYDSVAGKVDRIQKLQGRHERSLENCVAAPDGRTVAFAGNDGFILLFDAKQKMLKSTVKLNGTVRAICFSGEHELLASGSDGEVYRFDMRTRRCLERFANEDGRNTSCLAASDRHVAVGSQSGVVNLYTERPRPTRKPIKSIMNLRTSVDCASFNENGDILAISSRMEMDALKLVHVPTSTVFSNWPTSKTPLHYASCVDFSPESRFLAIGNDRGKCLLYKLKHYADA